MDTQTEREKYQRTGRVDWLRFIPWLFVITVTSAALACGLNFAYRQGHYYVLLFPIVTGMAVGGLVYLAVQFGHCRSRLVAALTGLFAGTLLYLGYYQAGLVSELGLPAISHVELLPSYIKFRMNSDVIADSNYEHAVGRRTPRTNDTEAPDEQPEPPRSPLSGKSIENWLTFAFEFLLVLCISVGFGFTRSRRAYCERCRKWMDQETAIFLPDLGSEFLAAFNSGQFPVITNARAVPLLRNTPFTGAAIDYCAPVAGRAPQCPVYFSIKEGRAVSVGQPGQFDNVHGKKILNRVKLTAAEILGLLPRFPVLASLGGAASAAPAFATAPATASSGLSMVPPAASVQIKTAVSGAEGKVLTRKNILIGNVFSLSILVLFFGGIGALAGGAWLLIPDDSPAAVPHSTLRIASGIALIVCGLPAAIAGAVVGLRNPSILGNRRLLALCRRNFRNRSEHLLDLNDPAVVFVEIVPRKNWGRVMLETAEDVGFMRIDAQRREIVFEGDRDCIRIPGDAILSCDVEEVVSAGDQRVATVYSMTVIRARHSAGFWEMPFAQRWTAGRVNNNKRYLRACELQQQILALRPVP